MDRQTDISLLLDQQYGIVEMLPKQTNAQSCVPINVSSLKVSPSLQDIESTDSSSSLTSVVKGCLLPLVTNFNFKASLSAKRRNSFNRVDLCSVVPVCYLDKGVVQRDTTFVVP